MLSAVAIHKERRTLPFTPEQIFDLVADVERYPDFLPLWHKASTSRSEQDQSLYFTEQTLQLGPVRKTFRTETRMQRPSQIRVISNDPLFDEFTIQWLLGSLPDNTCQVDFSLHCVAASMLLHPVIEVVLGEAAQSIVSAFERRAYAMYGR
ncbi:MAG: type II toxin-antitoxin system RatA family toxin [Gammaproteobacteria bacterium]|nr:type II toxin-antitoxin system RatA family toxin [Gammaproteobacteria bacterium]